MQNIRLTTFIIIILIIVAAGVYVAYTRPETAQIAVISPTPGPSVTLAASIAPTDRPTQSPARPTAEATGKKTSQQILAELKAGGSSYTDTNGVYSMLYPNDYKLDRQSDTMVRIYKNGPTQRGQTEQYDGVIMTFESIDLAGQRLEQWVDANVSNATRDGTSEVVEAKKAVTVNGHPGFTYTLRGLGIFKYVVLQKENGSSHAVSIVSAVNDPQGVGFQQEVDAIMASLALLK